MLATPGKISGAAGGRFLFTLSFAVCGPALLLGSGDAFPGLITQTPATTRSGLRGLGGSLRSSFGRSANTPSQHGPYLSNLVVKFLPL